MRRSASDSQVTRLRRRGRRRLRIALAAFAFFVAAAGAGLGVYHHYTLHFDDGRMDPVMAAGFAEKQTTTPGGATLNYAEGPDNGPALLLLHGQVVSWEDYYTVLPELAKDHHVYAVDYYGHGGSTHDADLYTAAKIGEDLEWFARRVIAEQFAVSGHSSGAILAALVAGRAPDLVTGVVLEDPPFFSVTPEEMQEGPGTFVWKDSFVPIHEFLNQSAETDYPTYYMGHSYLVGMFGSGARGYLVDATRAWRAEHRGEPLKLAWVPPVMLAGFYCIDDYDLAFGEAFYDGSWMAGIDQDEVLRSVTARTVYLKARTQYGKDGTLFAANSDEDADRVMSDLPNATRIVIGSGHDIHVEHPDAFIEAIRSLPR